MPLTDYLLLFHRWARRLKLLLFTNLCLRNALIILLFRCKLRRKCYLVISLRIKIAERYFTMKIRFKIILFYSNCLPIWSEWAHFVSIPRRLFNDWSRFCLQRKRRWIIHKLHLRRFLRLGFLKMVWWSSFLWRKICSKRKYFMLAIFMETRTFCLSDIENRLG